MTPGVRSHAVWFRSFFLCCLCLLTLVWLADYFRRRWRFRALFSQTREAFDCVTLQRIVERELEDAQPLEILLQARSSTDRWYYLRRYELLRRSLETLERSSEDWLLDVGCGDGFLLGELMDRKGWSPTRMVGVEVSLRNLELVGERLGRTVHRVVADAEYLPFGRDCFRAVLSTEVLEHTLHPESMSEELARVCQRGGALFLSTPSRHSMAVSFFNPLTWIEATLGLFVPSLLPPYHNLERPRDLDSVIHRAFTAQELQRLFRRFSTRRLTTYHFRLPSPLQRRLNPSRVEQLEEALAILPLLNRLGLTFLFVAQK